MKTPKNVRVRAMHDDQSYSWDPKCISVEARVGRKWVQVRKLKLSSEDYDDELAKAVSLAQHRAAVTAAWI